MKLGLLLVIQTDIVFDRIRQAAEQISIGDDLCQARWQHGNRQRKGARHSGKNLCLVLKIC